MNTEEATTMEEHPPDRGSKPSGPFSPVKKAITFFRARVAQTRGELFHVPKKAAATIIARADVGFGNALYVRGLGPGLSWETGVPMTCMADNEWRLELGGVMKPVTFKLLLNDEQWAEGGDNIVEPGGSVELLPVF